MSAIQKYAQMVQLLSLRVYCGGIEPPCRMSFELDGTSSSFSEKEVDTADISVALLLSEEDSLVFLDLLESLGYEDIQKLRENYSNQWNQFRENLLPLESLEEEFIVYRPEWPEVYTVYNREEKQLGRVRKNKRLKWTWVPSKGKLKGNLTVEELREEIIKTQEGS